MNFYDTRNSYLQLKEELSKIKTQADFHQVENHIKENLLSLKNIQIKELIESFNKKGGNLNLKEFLQLKEAIEVEEDDFDLLADNDEEYVDIDDDENLIDDEEEPNEYKTVIVSNIEPFYTMGDINELEADELGITPEDYLDDCINNIKTYIIDELGESFLLDIPVEYCDNDSDVEDYISEYISDETGYLVDTFNWEWAEEDNNEFDESCLKEKPLNERKSAWEMNDIQKQYLSFVEKSLKDQEPWDLTSMFDWYYQNEDKMIKDLTFDYFIEFAKSTGKKLTNKYFDLYINIPEIKLQLLDILNTRAKEIGYEFKESLKEYYANDNDEDEQQIQRIVGDIWSKYSDMSRSSIYELVNLLWDNISGSGYDSKMHNFDKKIQEIAEDMIVDDLMDDWIDTLSDEYLPKGWQKLFESCSEEKPLKEEYNEEEIEFYDFKDKVKPYYLKIGQEVANLWGAQCYDAGVDLDKKNVIFFCIEDGEKFITKMSVEEANNKFNELKAKEYKDKFKDKEESLNEDKKSRYKIEPITKNMNYSKSINNSKEGENK